MNGFHFYDFKGHGTPSKKLLDLLSREARWDDEAGDLNPDGLRLSFVKIDEPPAPKGSVTIRYRVFAEGAPENKVYAFSTWLMNHESSTDSNIIYVNGQGLLMIHKPAPEQELSVSAPGDELVVTATAGSAEPIRYLFSRRDGQFLLTATIVPQPVVAEDHGCQLEVRLAAPDASSVLIVARGFPDGTKIPLILESENNVIDEEITTNLNGRAEMAVFPFVPGKTQGNLRASAEGPGCVPTVVLPWGPAATPGQ